jgi:hypothetical protein
VTEVPHTPPLRRGEHTFDPMLPKSAQKSSADVYQSGADTSRELHGTSRVFVAGYNSKCPRCERWIAIGEDAHYHNDYSDPVHVGCKDVFDNVNEAKSFVIKGKRNPTLCEKCWLEHVGDCM